MRGYPLRANPDRFDGIGIADGYFIGSDPDNRTILVVELMEILVLLSL